MADLIYILSLHFLGGTGVGMDRRSQLSLLARLTPGARQSAKAPASISRSLPDRGAICLSLLLHPAALGCRCRYTQYAAEPCLVLTPDSAGFPKLQLWLCLPWVLLRLKKLREPVRGAVWMAYHSRTHRSVQNLGHAPWLPEALPASTQPWAISTPCGTSRPRLCPGGKCRLPFARVLCTVHALMISLLRLSPSTQHLKNI